MSNLTLNVDSAINTTFPIEQGVDETAVIETLVQTYYDDLLRLSLSILKDEAEAEDATQETFVKAALHLHSFQGNASIKTWLFAIGVNQCRQMLRKRKRRQGLSQKLQQLTDRFIGQPTPEQLYAHSEANETIWTAVAQLKEKHRLPIILHYVHNLTTHEIAEILETRPGTIQSRLHYGRKKLHACLKQSDFFEAKEERPL